MLFHAVILALVRDLLVYFLLDRQFVHVPNLRGSCEGMRPYAHFGAEASEKMNLMALQFLGMGRTPPMRARPL
jgi:hypothetical protein